jgi:mannose-1-phosphate guanylyltransferase
LETIYSGFESISVDYGIMEHARNIYLVEGNFDWNDLGSWESVYQVSDKDSNGNATSGTREALFLDSNNSFVHTDTGLVAIIGLDDVMVVRDGNAVLVCRTRCGRERETSCGGPEATKHAAIFVSIKIGF